MNTSIQIVSLSLILVTALPACTTAKLEARIEANPQCKDSYNAKTGALMPCPGTDKSFYVAAGLEAQRQTKSAPIVSNIGDMSPSATPLAVTPATKNTANTQPSSAVQSGCKPTIHRKTGGALPCPSQD